MSVSYSRRDFIGSLFGAGEPVRPPWSGDAVDFTELCDACGACIRVCPKGILKKGRAGLPHVDMTVAGCDFCGLCAERCAPGALDRSRSERPWDLVAVVSESCLDMRGISCRACEASCDADAIRFRPALGGRTDIHIDIEICTGCGCCVAPCPVGALAVIAAAPAQSEYSEKPS